MLLEMMIVHDGRAIGYYSVTVSAEGRQLDLLEKNLITLTRVTFTQAKTVLPSEIAFPVTI